MGSPPGPRGVVTGVLRRGPDGGPGRAHRERGGADHSLVLEVQVEVVGPRTRDGGEEHHLRSRLGGAVAGRAVGVDVEVGQVAGAECDQVTVRTEVGVEVGDRLPVAFDRERQLRVGSGGQVPVEGDGVAVDPGGARLPRRFGGLVGAGDGEVGTQGQPLGPGGLEVGEQAPLSRRQVQPGRPPAVGGQLGVHVLEAGEVAAYGDQVQLLLVLDVVRRHRLAVRPGDREPHRNVVSGSGRRLGQGQGVAVLGDHQPSWNVRAVRGLPRGVVLVDTVVGAVAVVGHRSRRLRLGSERLSDAERQGERGGQRHDEPGDLAGGVHASW